MASRERRAALYSSTGAVAVKHQPCEEHSERRDPATPEIEEIGVQVSSTEARRVALPRAWHRRIPST